MRSIPVSFLVVCCDGVERAGGLLGRACLYMQIPRAFLGLPESYLSTSLQPVISCCLALGQNRTHKRLNAAASFLCPVPPSLRLSFPPLAPRPYHQKPGISPSCRSAAILDL